MISSFSTKSITMFTTFPLLKFETLPCFNIILVLSSLVPVYYFVMYISNMTFVIMYIARHLWIYLLQSLKLILSRVITSCGPLTALALNKLINKTVITTDTSSIIVIDCCCVQLKSPTIQMIPPQMVNIHNLKAGNEITTWNYNIWQKITTIHVILSSTCQCGYN